MLEVEVRRKKLSFQPLTGFRGDSSVSSSHQPEFPKGIDHRKATPPRNPVRASFHDFYCQPASHKFGDVLADINRSALNISELSLSESDTIRLWIDRVEAVILLLLFFPLMVLIALAIKIDSKGPVFFQQKRFGQHKRKFAVYKFRTMYHKVDAYNESIIQTSYGDSRVTRVGHFLRSKSLDELPQLLNVLRGDMAMVGPRPHAIEHDEIFGQTLPHYNLRFKVKPGLTGLAQISGFRGKINSPDEIAYRLALDLHYIRERSLGLDLRILFKTTPKIWFDSAAF